jgi:outer membrane protein TolC
VEGYLKASQLHEESAIVESELENHEKRLQQLEGMRSRGLASRADSLEAQARIDEVRAELHSLQSGYRAAMKNLEAVTGLDLHQRQLISIPARAWQGTPALIEQDWLTPALAGSGAVQRARGELNVAEATHSMEQGGFLPEAYLSLRHINNDTFATNLREETRLELQLRMPLFKGGSTTARTRQTKERIHASRYQLQDTENAIRVEVARLTEDLSGSHSRIQSLQAAQQSAEAALEAADRGFIGGVRSLNELLDSRNRVSRVQRSLTAERHNNLILQFKLRQTAGTLVASDITGIFGN